MALYLGHRESNDLDFMTSQPKPSKITMTKIQELDQQAKIISTSEYSVHAELDGVRLSYFGSLEYNLRQGPASTAPLSCLWRP